MDLIRELIKEQSIIANLLLEEKSNEKTAIEAKDNKNYQLLIAAYEAVNKVVHNYLVKF